MRRATQYLLWVSIWLLASPLAATAADPPVRDLKADREEARIIVRQFAQAIEKALQERILVGHLVDALAVCSAQAPEIALGIPSGSWSVRRTALRVRNPDNAPNRQEKAILLKFRAQARLGDKISGMESIELTTRLGRPVVQYMQAIPMDEMCATCHGKNIEPDLALLIRARYPEDRATGYPIGALRGAYTLYKPLPQSN